jgi:hypothetical protein
VPTEQIARRASEIDITSTSTGQVTLTHRTCGVVLASLESALLHPCPLEVKQPDAAAPGYLDAFVTANLRDWTSARQRQRDHLVRVARRLTTVRVAVDDAFEALALAEQNLAEDEMRQQAAEESLHAYRRQSTRDVQSP